MHRYLSINYYIVIMDYPTKMAQLSTGELLVIGDINTIPDEYRSQNIHHLTSGEARCPALCVGYTKGELLPPYGSGIDSRDAKRIINYAEERKAIKLESAAPLVPLFGDLLDVLLSFQPEEIEVMGSYAEECVSSVIEVFLGRGIPVRVDTDKLIWRKKRDYCEQLEMLTEYTETLGGHVVVESDHMHLYSNFCPLSCYSSKDMSNGR